MSSIEPLDNLDKNEHIKVLETQIANRNAEIAMLHREVEEKIKLYEELLLQHKLDSERLAEMTNLLETASVAINSLQEQINGFETTENVYKAEVDDLNQRQEKLKSEIKTKLELEENLKQEIQTQKNIEEKLKAELIDTKNTTEQLAKEIVLLKKNVDRLEQELVELREYKASSLEIINEKATLIKKEQSKVKVFRNLFFVVATVTMLWSTVSNKMNRDSFSLSAKSPNSSETTEQDATPGSGPSPQGNQNSISQGQNSLSTGVPDVKSKENDLKIDENHEKLKQIINTIKANFLSQSGEEGWEESPLYKDTSSPVVITRSQFRDIVSRNLPTSLPTRVTDGMILYSFNNGDIDTSQFEQQLASDGVPHAPLCNPFTLTNPALKRISIFVSDTNDSILCLKKFAALESLKNVISELTIIEFLNEAQFSLSYTVDKQFISFQQWNINWITKVILCQESDNFTVPESRGQCLAKTARALSKSSDVRVQVPVLKPAPSTVLDLPNTNSVTSYVSFGNFSIIPSSLPQGPIKATRLSYKTGKPAGNTILQNLVPNARAVIINGSEQ